MPQPPKKIKSLPWMGSGMTQPHEHARAIIHKHFARLVVLLNWSEEKLYAVCRAPESAAEDRNTGRRLSFNDFLAIGAALASVDPADARRWMQYPLDYLSAVSEVLSPEQAQWDSREAGERLIDLGTRAGVALLKDSEEAKRRVMELRDEAERALIKLHAGKD
jgi:hypothetical protein